MKTIILLDYDALMEAVKQIDVELEMKDFIDFLKSIHDESSIQTSYAYVGINEKLPHIKDKIIDELTRCGYIVRKVIGDNYGINFVSDCSQAITLDVLRAVYENNATNVILVSNSHKLENLVTLLREKDIIVETVFYGSLVDYDLAVKSTGFINLEAFISDEENIECANNNLNEDESYIKNILNDNNKAIEEDSRVDFFDKCNSLFNQFDKESEKKDNNSVVELSKTSKSIMEE